MFGRLKNIVYFIQLSESRSMKKLISHRKNGKQARDGRFAECTRSDFERADLLDFDITTNIRLPKFNFE